MIRDRVSTSRGERYQMADEYDFRENNVARRDGNGTTVATASGKKTNSQFKLADLPSDEEMYDDDERAEIERQQKEMLAEQQEAEESEETITDDEDVLVNAIVTDREKYSKSQIARNNEALFRDYSYTDVPRFPEEYRGANIIGLRTKPTGTSSVSIGAIAPKKKLRMIWDNLTPVEKYIMMLISDHRHLTTDQLETLVVLPTKIRALPGGGHQSIHPYFEWLTFSKYGEQLSYKETFKTSTVSGLEQKIGHLVDLGCIEEIQPSYHVHKNDDPEYNRTPSLFTSHYYLTAVGARVLICNTLATVPSEKPSERHGVGFVPTYRSSAYQSIVHETESTDTFVSMVRNAEFLSNIDALGLRADGDDTDYGFIDICRFYHEKDCEEKYVPYHDDAAMVDRTIDFKTDGKLVMYSSKLGEFLDYYLEYDSGSSSSSKISHKTEAFIRYILWKQGVCGYRFRRPVLLLVSQNPAAYMPGLRDDKPTRYTRGIQQMTKSCFPTLGKEINDIATILECDCRALRMHGSIGACWHVLDLTTGVPERTAHDLIAASRGAIAGR